MYTVVILQYRYKIVEITCKVYDRDKIIKHMASEYYTSFCQLDIKNTTIKLNIIYILKSQFF